MLESPSALQSTTSVSQQIAHDQWRHQVLDWLAENVPLTRLNHILQVEGMAIALAQHHGLDPHQAAQAGLLHDLAKCFPPQRLLQLAEVERIPLDPILKAHPHLLHAEISAVIAQQEFGVHDAEILQAIRNHTLGQPGMSPLSCIVYLADSLEPSRGDHLTLKTLRQVSYENLHKAVWLTAEASISHLLGTRHLIHPRTLMTRNWFMQDVQNTPNPNNSEFSKDVVIND